ncbi:MAG: hypothetical protein LBV12_06375 [Puniceicoccales bacterium]|jgi:hypothetical protein|nr:hypothetical protein [Puniceicoccales bacterium]
MFKNPTSAVNAICPSPVTVGEITLQPMMLGHVLALQSLGSPFAQPGLDSTLDQVLQAVVILTLPSKEARRLAALGPDSEEMRNLAEDVSDRVSPSQLWDVAGAIRTLFVDAFASFIPTKGEMTAPATPAESAGASNSSPTSPASKESTPSTPSIESPWPPSTPSPQPPTSPTEESSPTETTSSATP